ncbi:hypothetical protein [Mesorhizobium waimense]|nr:hypothetical protein [Mesorhizobium waimense]
MEEYSDEIITHEGARLGLISADRAATALATSRQIAVTSRHP